MSRLRPKNETEFNSALRKAIRDKGRKCIHIRETDEPGTADLIIYMDDRIEAWMELKYGHPIGPPSNLLDVSQHQFLRKHAPEAWVALYSPSHHKVLFYFVESNGELIHKATFPYREVLESCEFLNMF